MIVKIVIFFIVVVIGISIYFIPIFKKLPAPTGRYGVGTTSYRFSDITRKETHVKEPHGARELMVSFWYPSAAVISTTKKNVQNYLGQLAPVMQKQFVQKTKLPGWLLKPFLTLKTHTQLQSSLASDKKKYPLIIFSHGFRAPLELYTTYIEELASQGYIVVGINHTYATYATVFPDGRVVDFNQYDTLDHEEKYEQELEVWIADTTFVLSKLKELNAHDSLFKNKLDLENLGLMGHSFGGITAVAVAQTEKSCKALVNLDGPLSLYKHKKQESTKPFLFLIQEYARTNNRATTQKKLDKLTAFCKNSSAIGRIIEFKNAGHQTFDDLIFLKYPFAWIFNFDIGSRNAYTTHALICTEIVSFFNEYVTSFKSSGPHDKICTIEHK